MSAAKKTKGIIRKGPSTGRGSRDFISLKDGDRVTVVPVLPTSEIMSIDVHGFWDTNPGVQFACLAATGENCPGCELDNEAGYRAFLPVLDENGELKVFPFGIGVERKIVSLEDEVGEVVGLKLRVTRDGNGLKTRYDVINTGKHVEVDVEEDDAREFVESKIEIKSRSQIIEELVAAGYMDEDDDSSSKSSKKASKAADDDDEDEEEEEAPHKKGAKEKVVKGGKASKEKVVKGKKAKRSDDEWDD